MLVNLLRKSPSWFVQTMDPVYVKIAVETLEKLVQIVKLLLALFSHPWKWDNTTPTYLIYCENLTSQHTFCG